MGKSKNICWIYSDIKVIKALVHIFAKKSLKNLFYRGETYMTGMH